MSIYPDTWSFTKSRKLMEEVDHFDLMNLWLTKKTWWSLLTVIRNHDFTDETYGFKHWTCGIRWLNSAENQPKGSDLAEKKIVQTGMVSPTNYPGVNIQKTMENHNFQWVNPLFLWPCSIAMLVCQRVMSFLKNYIDPHQLVLEDDIVF